MKWLLTVVMCLALAGCAATQVSEATPHATLTFSKGYTTGQDWGRNESTLQAYWLAEDCANWRRAAAFAWVNGGTTSRRVPINQPVQLVAITEFYSSALVTAAPHAMAQFLPQQGHHYEIVHQETPGRTLVLSVVDTATGAAPPDLVVRDPSPCLPPSQLQ